MIFSTLASFVRALVLLSVVNGQLLHNITIDDTDPAITYTGLWTIDPPDYGFYQGGHHWSSRSGAYATFTFTGVAVYYLAPLYSGYAGGVSTLLSLDSGPAQLVNLTLVSSEPSYAAVRWSASGLANGTHTVINTLGRSAQGELAMWAVVDGFIYTVQDPPTPSSTQPNPTSSGTSSVSSPSSVSPPSSVPVAAIAVSIGVIAGGVVGGVAFVVLLGLLAYFLVFKRSFIRKGSVGDDQNAGLNNANGQSGWNPRMRDQDGHSTYNNGPSQGSFLYRGLPEPGNK